MLHYPLAVFVITMLGKNTAATAYTFWQVFIPTVILTIVFSAFLKWIMDYLKSLKEA